MKSVKEWLIKPIVKSVLMGGLTVVIGIIGSFIGIVQGSEVLFFVLLLALFALFVLYVILIVFYNTSEVNYIERAKELEHQNKTYELAMINFISIFQLSARHANKLIHEIVRNGKVNLNTWNFDLASTLICEKIYTMLCELDEKCKDFDVGYIRLDESEKTNNIIYMNAYANRSRTQPSKFFKRRDITEPKSYYDAQFFAKGKGDIEILMNENEIGEKFEYRTAEGRKNKGKYSQYIGIPVLCTTDFGSKMVGLLEIVCLDGHKLSSEKNVVMEMAEKYFMPYAQLLLLLHKLEKSLLAVPAGSKEG